MSSRASYFLGAGVWLACAVGLAAAGDSVLTLKLLPGTRCLDGSPAGYAHSPVLPNVTDWVVYLMGGGACAGKAACVARSKTVLGSSTSWPASLSQPGNVLDGNCSVNPTWCNANRVFVPYCTGDVHIGGRFEASRDTWGLYFSGHNNLAAVLDDLDAAYGMSSSATSVLLSGGSAGGIGSFLNADFVGQRFQGRGIRYRAAPQGGWFFPNVTTFPSWVNGSWLPPYSPEAGLLWNASCVMSKQCQAEYGAGDWRCFSMDTAYRYISTALLVGENTVDSQQLYGELGVPQSPVSGAVKREVAAFVDWYQGRMLSSMDQVRQAVTAGTKPLDGVWMPACFDHTGDIDLVHPRLVVRGKTYGEALRAWWDRQAGPSNASDQVLVARCAVDDPEGGPCSSHCDHQPPPPLPRRALSPADLSALAVYGRAG